MIKNNSTCFVCKKRFNASTNKIVVCFPCNHYYHEKCLKSLKSNICTINDCNQHILKTYDKFSVNSMKENCDETGDTFGENKQINPIQYYINLLSLERSTYKPSIIDIFMHFL